MKFILKHKYVVIAIFVVITVVCAIASAFVKVDYNLMDYLPDESPSTVALNTMKKEYSTGIPNARVMVKNVSVPQALEYKEKLKAVDGVDEVTWLDDAINVYQPLEFAEQKTVEEYYKDKNALFTLTINEDKQQQALKEVRAIIGESGAMSGDAVNTATAINLTTAEINKIMVLLVIVVFAILILTTTSYFDAVIFLITIGAAIFINRGTNLFFGKISFVTNAAGSILQLAVSMDYSIFLLHRFLEYRQEDSDIEHAMLMAVKKSFGTVVSSGMTAVMGFTALILMKFKIGPDMGIIMAKALAISLVSVMLFFPVLALAMCKLVEKTKHKPFVPSFDKFGEIVFKVGKPMLIVFAVMLIPCYLAQQKNDFTYGQSGIYGKGTQLGNDTKRIEDIFGKSNLMVLMIPKENFSKEKEVSAELLENKNVTSVLSYAETVGVQIPEEIVPNDTLKKLVSDHYSRIVITADVPTEGESSFNLVDKIKQTAQKHFDNDYMLVGETVNTYDLKDVITSDDVKVNLLAMLSIAIILLINMKSLILPVILLAIIKLSIWINLTVPYFANEKLFYIGYLIIGSIQLGATVDYAILFADRYIENRENKLPVLAAKRTLSDTTVSILTSAGILTCAGLMLGIISSNKIISQLGILVGRGAVFSCILVLFVLPVLLVMFDTPIQKLTKGLKFYKEEKKK